MKKVAIPGTFDSKGPEFAFIKALFESAGVETLTIHTGVFSPYFEPDISNRVLFEAAGEDADEMIRREDRGAAVAAISRGLEKVLPELYAEKKFDGVLSLGGSGGTSLVAPAMRALPLGVPKIIVSTVASGNVEKYIGTSDLILIPSIVDVSGINDISRMIFTNAVYAMKGMLGEPSCGQSAETKPMIAASMFGVTTPCVDKAKKYLEERGYEVLVFHATGVGGKTMERLIREGYFKGVLDLTTTEWCDEIVGGELAAGPDRGEAASLKRVPQVVSVGADDMVNFGPRETVPERFSGRSFYQHNPMVTLMRTSAEENRKIAEELAEKWNLADPSRIVVMLPRKGVSMIDAEGEPFWGPEEDRVLFDTIHEKLNPGIRLLDLDCNINDDDFALTAAKQLLEMIESSR